MNIPEQEIHRLASQAKDRYSAVELGVRWALSQPQWIDEEAQKRISKLETLLKVCYNQRPTRDAVSIEIEKLLS